jgi:pimeloyl-ACP methyl ester carboxylesterase
MIALALLAAVSPFGKMVDLGGRRVHIHCEGTGSPTVVLLHGTPRFSFHFALVQPKVAGFARVCVYDRAGDAWSEPVPGQPTAEIFVEELDRVIRHVSPRRPVVLAGHSVGAVLALAYYGQHPERVAAMVLIDPAQLQGPPRGPGPSPKGTLAPPFDKLPPRYYEAHLWATDQWYAYAARVDPVQARQYQADLYKMAAGAHSATLPVWFLFRAGRLDAPDLSRWGNGRLVQVPHSGHDIELDQPDAVAGAIGEAARSTRAKAE